MACPRRFACREKTMRNPAALVVLLLLALPLSLQAAPLCITDDEGERICLSAPARRIIPLYASFSEILLDMGLADRIIARTTSDIEPAFMAKLPGIGTHMRPNLELVAGLAPDLVLQMGGRDEATQSVAALRRLGVKVAFFRIGSFAELFSVVQRLGVLSGKEEAAEALQNRLKTRLAAVAVVLGNTTQRPTVFFELRYPNLLAAGPGAMVTDVIRRAGGVNGVTGKADDRVVRLSEEALIALDPEVYLMQQGPMNKNPQPLAERPHFATLRAHKTGRVLVVDEKLFSRPGPRTVDAVEQLAVYLHPDLFPAGVIPALERK